jgi:hypothetical protein
VEFGSRVRVLAIYYEFTDMDVPKCLQADVSRERGLWSISRLLGSGQLDEIRLVGETRPSVGVVRMLVRAGRFRRVGGPSRQLLWMPGDECYPAHDPFIFIRPEPEPAAFT